MDDCKHGYSASTGEYYGDCPRCYEEELVAYGDHKAGRHEVYDPFCQECCNDAVLDFQPYGRS
jgi:hypothetical protein